MLQPFLAASNNASFLWSDVFNFVMLDVCEVAKKQKQFFQHLANDQTEPVLLLHQYTDTPPLKHFYLGENSYVNIWESK